MPPQHLLVDISAHGFGHLAQTAPVLNALRLRMPDLQLTICSGLSQEQLSLRIHAPFTYLPGASDFGLCMQNAMDVDVPESIKRYQVFHAHWDHALAEYAQKITRIKADLILANISYLALAAAQRAQVPALAMCSLNWFDIVTPYASTSSTFTEIQRQMLAAYNSAAVFLRLTPGMPMPHIQHLTAIGPIATQGKKNRDLLHTKLGIASSQQLILVAMGGLPMPLPKTWPELPGYHWIVPREASLQREDMACLESIDMPFSDVLASCDCVLTKSAYGVFVEATLCDTPVIYVERPDWPEEVCLVDWLKQNHRSRRISREQFEQGTFGSTIHALLQAPRMMPILPTGIDQAVQQLEIQFSQLRK